jgi:hypothetical protein
MYVNGIQKIPDIFDNGGSAGGQELSATGNGSFGEIFNRLLNADGGTRLDAPEGIAAESLSFADAKYRLSKAGKADPDIDAKMHKKIETAINWLARYLGIKPSFLLAVFDELNIDPNDMADQAKFMEIINKIAAYFELDEDQKKEIARELGGILGFQS